MCLEAGALCCCLHSVSGFLHMQLGASFDVYASEKARPSEQTGIEKLMTIVGFSHPACSTAM